MPSTTYQTTVQLLSKEWDLLGITAPPANAAKKEMRGLNAEPEPALTTGQMEPLSQLRVDAEWWLVSSNGATNMVIIIQISKQPDALDLEVWKMKPKPSRGCQRRSHFAPVQSTPMRTERSPHLTPPSQYLIQLFSICQPRMRQTS